ncbi:HAD-IIIA family hydrolase [Paenibacillus xylanexedens]|uniref:HAD-IIIA family hydrolase n=1 Tax=Paenibacillus xylanexedens TaxID=528191 RepID=UPI0011A5B2B6|nr:HAD-IIIA family hydrolase [Paenibacillus xylanexedens]
MTTPNIRNVPTQAVFIDRDGTIGGSDKIEYPGEMQLFDGVAESISTLSQHGFKLFGFTNQPGITAGHSTVEAFQQEMKHFGIEHTYVCPHPAHEQCKCRKPRPDMLIQAAEDHQLKLEQCIVIGDRWSDMVAASVAGCLCILVMTGAGMRALEEDRFRWNAMEADYVATDFNDAVKWIVQRRVQPMQE